MFDSLIIEVGFRIAQLEKHPINEPFSKRDKYKKPRTRLRKAADEERFLYAVRYILTDLINAHNSLPKRYCKISLDKDYYRNTSKYSNPKLGYEAVSDVYEGLQQLEMVQQVKGGHYDSGTGERTKYTSGKRFDTVLEYVETTFEVLPVPDLSLETIILNDRVYVDDNKKSSTDKPKKQVVRRQRQEYVHTDTTQKYKDNLLIINKCLCRHWVDLRIRDSMIPELERRLATNKEKENRSLDLRKRTLRRVFSRGKFTLGGRYYGHWVHTLPSKIKKKGDIKYRKYISIDGNNTRERDFSAMHPTMAYLEANVEMQLDDPYTDIFPDKNDPNYRVIAKRAFNAMLNADWRAKFCPRDLAPLLKQCGVKWESLVNKILEVHAPIEHLFFKGKGTAYQFKDSVIAEQVMLHFAKMDVPIIPVHDSFVYDYHYDSEVYEEMLKAWKVIFGINIQIDMAKRDYDDENVEVFVADNPDVLDTLLQDHEEHLQWSTRNLDWAKKKPKILKEVAKYRSKDTD